MLKVEEQKEINMAEEKHIEDFAGSDDMNAMRVVLKTVKGISPISLTPALDPIYLDEDFETA